MAELVIHQRPAAGGRSGAFELEIEGRRLGHLDYTLPDARSVNIDYVEVSPSLRGKQMGVKLVEAAVSWARSHKRMVSATCSYARAVLKRTPAFQDVVRK